MKRNDVWMWAAAALLCTTIASSYVALSLQSEVRRLRTEYDGLLEDIEFLQDDLNYLTIRVDIRMNYGNGTVV